MFFRTGFAGPARSGFAGTATRRNLAHPALMIGLVANALVMAAPAHAAPDTDGDNAPITTGGLLSTTIVDGRKWTASATLNTLSDSNFRRAPVPESAIRVTPAVNVGLGLPLGRQQLFLGGNIGRDFVLGHREFNRNRYAIGGGVAWQVGTRCTGIVGGEHQSRLNQVLDQAQFTPNVQRTDVVAASANCRTATGLGAGASIRHQAISNDRQERRPFNLRSTVIAPNLSYSTNAIGQFSVGATFNNTAYPERSVPTTSGFVADGVKIFSARFGYSRQLGSRLSLSLGASYLKTSPKPETILTRNLIGQIVETPRAGFKGTGYDASVSYHPSTRLTIDIAGSRNAHVSPNAGALFVISQALSANASYKLGSKLDFGLGISQIKNSYKEPFVTVDEPVRRVSDRVSRVSGQLDYSPVSLYSIGVVVAHQWRDSTPSTFDYKSTTASVRLRVKFGRV